MNRKLSQKLIAASLPTVLAVPLAHAQSTDLIPESTIQDPTTTLEPSVIRGANEIENEVTAFKTGTALKDIPQSLTIFTAEEIEKRGLTSLADIVDYTPGLTNSQGEGHRDAIVFRGVRSTADFFLDGVRDDVQYYRSLYNLEKVEVLRGPSALHFGRGGTGGVINRVTKKAIVGENFGSLNTSIDTFGAHSVALDYNFQINDKAALRINSSFESLNNHRDFFDGERFGFNPTFTYEISPDTTFNLSYEYAKHQRFIDRGIPSGDDGEPERSVATTVFGDSNLNTTELEAHIFRARLEHAFSENWKGSVTGTFANYNKLYSNFFASDFDNATNQVEIDGYVDTTDRQRFTISGDLIGEFNTGSVGHKLILGGEYIRTSSDQDRLNNVFASNGDDQQFFDAANFRLTNGVVIGANGTVIDTGSFTDPNDDTEVTIDAFSFFLQDEIAITKKLDLILGARFDSFNIDVINNLNGTDLSNTDEEISPRLGIVYKPTERLSLYGSFTESFLPRSGEQFSDIDDGLDALDADTFSNLEFGLKWNITDNLGITLSAFQIEQESAVVSDADAGLLSIIESEVEGFEFQLEGYITDKWYIAAGYSYLEGDQVGGDTDGLRVRELPRHSASIWNRYQVNNKLNIGLGIVYQDESFSDNANTVTLPDFVRVDAAVIYDVSDSLRLQLNVENLTDINYFPNSHTANNITVGKPINATLSISNIANHNHRLASLLGRGVMLFCRPLTVIIKSTLKITASCDLPPLLFPAQ